MNKEVLSQLIAVGGSILGCIIGGLITYFCSYKTLKQERKIEQQNRIIEAKKVRPRLTISSFTGKYEKKNSNIPNIELQLLEIENVIQRNTVPFFEYIGENVNENELVYYDFEFENEGHCEICELTFTTSNSKYFNVIDFNHRKFYIENKTPNIYVNIDDLYIKPGDKFRIRIYCSKLIADKYIPDLTIWLRDSIDYIWIQNLSILDKKISNSRIDRYGLFRLEIDINSYIDRFKEYRNYPVN